MGNETPSSRMSVLEQMKKLTEETRDQLLCVGFSPVAKRLMPFVRRELIFPTIEAFDLFISFFNVGGGERITMQVIVDWDSYPKNKREKWLRRVIDLRVVNPTINVIMLTADPIEARITYPNNIFEKFDPLPDTFDPKTGFDDQRVILLLDLNKAQLTEWFDMIRLNVKSADPCLVGTLPVLRIEEPQPAESQKSSTSSSNIDHWKKALTIGQSWRERAGERIVIVDLPNKLSHHDLYWLVSHGGSKLILVAKHIHYDNRQILAAADLLVSSGECIATCWPQFLMGWPGDQKQPALDSNRLYVLDPLVPDHYMLSPDRGNSESDNKSVKKSIKQSDKKTPLHFYGSIQMKHQDRSWKFEGLNCVIGKSDSDLTLLIERWMENDLIQDDFHNNYFIVREGSLQNDSPSYRQMNRFAIRKQGPCEILTKNNFASSLRAHPLKSKQRTLIIFDNAETTLLSIDESVRSVLCDAKNNNIVCFAFFKPGDLNKYSPDFQLIPKWYLEKTNVLAIDSAMCDETNLRKCGLPLDDFDLGSLPSQTFAIIDRNDNSFSWCSHPVNPSNQ